MKVWVPAAVLAAVLHSLVFLNRVLPPPVPAGDIYVERLVVSEVPSRSRTRLKKDRAANPGVAGPEASQVKNEAPYFMPRPQYPAEALPQRLQGRVVLGVRTGPEGWVEGIEIEESSGSPLLDQQAVKDISRWRLGGLAQVRVPVEFRLVE